MTKSELIDAVAQRTNTTKSRAEQIVNCIFDSMVAALERGEGIEIRGFGSFTVREYKPYNGRNPRTGKPVSVAEKRLPFFKVGKELKELVNLPANQDAPAHAAPSPGAQSFGAQSVPGAQSTPGGEQDVSRSGAAHESPLGGGFPGAGTGSAGSSGGESEPR